MKKEYIYSVILGAIFFIVTYMYLDINLIFSIIIALVAYVGGIYIIKGKQNKKQEINEKEELNKILKNAKEKTNKIKEISKKVEDINLINSINEICEISNKIIKTLEKKPYNLQQSYNFLNYYLPVTIKILTRYDEIENQKLNTIESNNFMKSVESLMIKIKKAFQEYLSNLYQKDIIDTDAEIKVFEEMLKMDGFVNEIKIEENK